METRQAEDVADAKRADARRSAYEHAYLVRRDHVRTQAFRDHLAQHFEKATGLRPNTAKTLADASAMNRAKDAIAAKEEPSKGIRQRTGFGHLQAKSDHKGLLAHLVSRPPRATEDGLVRLPGTASGLEDSAARLRSDSTGRDSAWPPNPDAAVEPRRRARTATSKEAIVQDKGGEGIGVLAAVFSHQAGGGHAAQVPSDTRSLPMLTNVKELVRFTTIGATPCGAAEVQFGLAGSVLGGFTITIRSLGHRKVAMTARSNGANQSLIRRRAKSLIESLSAESIEVLEFVVK